MRLRSASKVWLAITSMLCVAIAFATIGCTPRSHELQPGVYRAVVKLPGGEVPFGLDIARDEQGYIFYLVNGKERLRVPSVNVVEGHVTAAFPGEGNVLDARVSGEDLTGKVTLDGTMPGNGGYTTGGTGPAGGKTVLDFSARRDQAWRFVKKPRTDNADFAGRWSITFTDDAGQKAAGVAELAQSFHTVTGAVRTKIWEQTSLAGDANNDELRLSLFDGRQAVLYSGALNRRGELIGECWSTSAGHARYTATRNPDAML